MPELHNIKLTYVTKAGRTETEHLFSPNVVEAKARILSMYNDIDWIVEAKRLD